MTAEKANGTRVRPLWIGWLVISSALVMSALTAVTALWLMMPHWLYDLMVKHSPSTTLAYLASEQAGAVSLDLERRHGSSAYERAQMVEYVCQRVVHGSEKARVFAALYLSFILRQPGYVLTTAQEVALCASLRDMLHQERSNAQVVAIFALCSMQRREFIPELITVIATLEDFPDTYALGQLAEFDDPRIAMELIAWSRTSPTSLVIASALAKQSDPAAIERAIDMASGLSPNDRMAWIGNLSTISDQRLLTTIAQACRETNAGIRSQALDALEENPLGIPHLLTLRSDPGLTTLHAQLDKILTRLTTELSPEQQQQWEAARSNLTATPP